MKILMLGKLGQVGTELCRCRWPIDVSFKSKSRSDLDLSDTSSVARLIRDSQPKFVINAAAYTGVDLAETEVEAAYCINSEAPEAIAKACSDIGSALIHISTDYVFDGTSSSPYREDDSPSPTCVYGKSKFQGEQNIRASLEHHVILRTAWIYSAHGTNFLKTILRLSNERRNLRIVADQIGSPTSACSVARAIQTIILSDPEQGSRWGTYHFCGAGEVSWYQFAKQIFDLASEYIKTAPDIIPVSTEDYPAMARRPAYSVLDCSQISREYGLRPKPWDNDLQLTIDELMS